MSRLRLQADALKKSEQLFPILPLVQVGAQAVSESLPTYLTDVIGLLVILVELFHIWEKTRRSSKLQPSLQVEMAQLLEQKNCLMLIYRHRNKDTAQWVTFIHGAGGSSSIWFKQIKSFSRFFNLLLIDLRGHGKSKNHLLDLSNSIYTFDAISDEILEVLDHEKIASSHFMGISLGTILIRTIAEKSPERVNSLIMGGAILKFNFKSRLLMRFGNATKSILPYMWLYKIMAFIIMPKQTKNPVCFLFAKTKNCTKKNLFVGLS